MGQIGLVEKVPSLPKDFKPRLVSQMFFSVKNVPALCNYMTDVCCTGFQYKICDFV